MGVLTDFFVANDQQLAAVFTGWLRVADKPVERQVKNPFTGQSQIAREWPPQGPVGAGELAEIPDVRQLPHVELKRIDHVKLARLHELLTGKPLRETLDVLMKPALVHPSKQETGLHELPRELTTAICELPEHALETIAAKWQQTEEMELDGMTVGHCAEVLRLLRGLTSRIESDQRTYLKWSL